MTPRKAEGHTDYMTSRATTAAIVAEHEDAGHTITVTAGVLICRTCDNVALDASGARPGLIAANQYR